MATRDFRSQQIRTTQIIASGTTVGTGQSNFAGAPANVPSLLIYSASAATNDQGAFLSTLTGSAGSDVWLFISGSTHAGAPNHYSPAQQVLFGGNVVVSGSLSGSTVSSLPAGDVTVKADGGINFIIDNDNSQTNALFSFKTNKSTEVAQIDEAGNLQIDGDLTLSGHDIKNSAGEKVITIEHLNDKFGDEKWIWSCFLLKSVLFALRLS